MRPPYGAEDRILEPDDPAYPPAFRRRADGSAPPLALRGGAAWPVRPAVAVVGARAATPYALRVAAQVAAGLARAGVGVVSGLARGVDAAAHEAALACGGVTLAVLGTGVDQVYPPEHRDLYTAVRRHGLLVSPLPHGAPPRRGHFPARNRLAAALVDGLVLVQAARGSGTRHTVRAVLAAGGWVLVAPWPLGDPQFDGNADWVASGQAGIGVLTDAALPARRARAPEAADPVLSALGRRPSTVDELVRRAGRPVEAVLVRLLELEMGGQIERLAGDRYRRRRA